MKPEPLGPLVLRTLICGLFVMATVLAATANEISLKRAAWASFAIVLLTRLTKQRNA